MGKNGRVIMTAYPPDLLFEEGKGYGKNEFQGEGVALYRRGRE